MQAPAEIKAIIGLGNPGPRFTYTRHNIGFLVLDALADHFHENFKEYNNLAHCTIIVNEKPILLVKPLTFMNNSGNVMPFITKKGIKAENILVIHDELDMPEGKLKLKFGGSARGHNGLRSIIAAIGDQFARLSVGIDRPANREEVANYVLENFENKQALQNTIHNAVEFIEKSINS